MTKALNRTARHHDECSPRRSAGTQEAKSLSQSFCIHQTSHIPARRGLEESSEEAILDTGASRTIIGSERVPQLEKALKGIEIQRGPSRCVFRFGNSVLLHREEALFLKRLGKGWLRVEIVPGSTPFLLSFHGSEDVLRLRQVRRKLNCVRVRELLNVQFHDGTGDNCLHMIDETTKQENTHSPPSDMHVEFENEPNHEERQTSSLQTTDLQQPAIRDPREFSAARVTDQETTTSSTSFALSRHGTAQDGSAAPARRFVGRRGRSSSPRDSSAAHIPVQGAGWDSKSPSMGTRDFQFRKAQGEDLCRDLRKRQRVCSVHSAQHPFDVCRHAQLPELCQGTQKEVVSGDVARAHHAEDSCSSPFCNELGKTPEQCSSRTSNQLRDRVGPDRSALHEQSIEADVRDTQKGLSDASFTTNKDTSSRQGTIIFTTDGRLACNQVGVVCPMAWSLKKIPRVARSTLSAEAVSLSASLDRLSWLRLFWEWLKDPSCNIMEPEVMLQKAPRSSIVTDCKILHSDGLQICFYVATKTSTPTCEEYRTCLECILIRERLKENCQLRWVSSQAQLADSLTKAMEGTLLRQCLEEGRYSLFDETAALKARSDRRNRLAWLKESTKHSSEKES